MLHAAWISLLCLITTAPPSSYEEELIAWGLERTHREIDPSPEDKPIEEILIASEDIVAPGDPWPKLINVFHVRTRERVIRREVLLNVGEPYRGELAAETERNLRALLILAVARVLPVKATSAGKVAVLVVTKDLLSIRLNSQFNTVGKLIQLLRLQPSELNFLGLNKQLLLDFLLQLDTLSLGQAYTDPRILGTHLSFSESAAIIFNRATHQAEGSRGSFTFGQPLYSLATEWGFALSGSWRVDRRRLYRGADVWTLPYPDNQQPTAMVPYAYDRRLLSAAGVYTWSFGRYHKLNVSAGYGGYSNRYTPPRDTGLSEDQRGWLLANYLPRSEDATDLTADVRAFEANYRVLRDIESFAISEDYQLGYMAIFHAAWAEPLLFSGVRYVTFSGGASYRTYWRENLAAVSVGMTSRFSPELMGFGSNHWINRRTALELIDVTPPIGIGRFAVRAMAEANSFDLAHTLFFLGGGDGLRGAPAELLSGTRLVLVNLEYRTRSIAFDTIHVGGVLFWDTGAAYGDTGAGYNRSLSLIHTVGLGLRILLPQFNKVPIRIDLGYAVNTPRPSFLDWISASYGQVFDYRPVLLDDLGL